MENIMKVFRVTLIIMLAFTATLNAQLVNQENGSGEKEGKWVKYFDNNSVKYEGQFHLGKPYGKFVYYYKNGDIKAVSEFEDNGTIANNITYYKSGKLMAEGKFVNQKKVGVWKYYLDQESNALVSTEKYSNGVLYGESITYYPNTDQPTEVVEFKNGKMNGDLRKFFPDGKIMTESYYVNGLPDGTFVHYHMDGNVQIVGNYSKGIQTGEWKYFDEEGKQVDEEEFKKQEEVRDIE